jgi:hypothetical protein
MIDFNKKHRTFRMGHRKRDWSDVWYRPAHANNPSSLGGDIDGGNAIARIMLFSSEKGEVSDDDPMHGEVNWIPNFDLANCESKIRKEKEIMHVQCLERAWLYLDAKTPEDVKTLTGKFNSPLSRRWQSWFEHARKWQDKKMKTKERARRNRRPTGVANNTDSESEREDSTYETDDELGRERPKKSGPMPPPPPPSADGKGPGRANPKRPNGSREGSGRNKKARVDSVSGSESESEPQPRDESYTMSGGLSQDSVNRPPNPFNGLEYLSGSLDDPPNRTTSYTTSSHIFVSDDDDDDNDEDEDESMFDAAAPPPPPHTYPNRPVSTPQASAQPSISSLPLPTPTSAPTTGLRVNRGMRARKTAVPHPPIGRDKRSSSSATPRPPAVRSSADRRAEEVNGAVDEAEAVQAAMRASMAPDERRTVNGGLDDDKAMEEAIRASMPPDEHGSGTA